MSAENEGKVFQLKVTLKGAKPPIWRRILVSPEMTLADLHDIIQDTMGWDNSHLFIFEVGHLEFPNPDPWAEDVEQNQDIEEVKLGEIIPRHIPEGKSFNYIYDLGDSWTHQIKVEKIISETNRCVPSCVGGARACPPEDVGGVYGYAYFLEAISDPEHEEHDTYTEWVGGPFDPDDFDPEVVNKKLKS